MKLPNYINRIKTTGKITECGNYKVAGRRDDGIVMYKDVETGQFKTDYEVA